MTKQSDFMILGQAMEVWARLGHRRFFIRSDYVSGECLGSVHTCEGFWYHSDFLHLEYKRLRLYYYHMCVVRIAHSNKL